MTNRYVSKAAISLLFGLAGCTAHSPMIVKSTTDTEQHSAKKYAPHANKVFITESDLGPAVKFELLADAHPTFSHLQQIRDSSPFWSRYFLQRKRKTAPFSRFHTT